MKMLLLWIGIMVCLGSINFFRINPKLDFTFINTGLVSHSRFKFLMPWANFDGVHYEEIAKGGYRDPLQAFFPMYPLLMNIISKVTGIELWLAGLAISWICLVLGTLIWQRVMGKNWLWFLVYPLSFYFLAVYTESLFWLMLGLYILSIKNKKYGLAMVIGIVLGLTRLIGVVTLVIPLILWVEKKNSGLWLAITGPILGLVSYMAYLQAKFGNAWLMVSAVSQFNTGRKVSTLTLFPQVIWRYLKILVTARVDFVYFMALLELVMFLGLLALFAWGLIKFWQDKKYLELGVIIFSTISLILPTTTGTFTSLPRYGLLLAGYVFLVPRLDKRLQIILFGLGLGLQIVLVSFFLRGWFTG